MHENVHATYKKGTYKWNTLSELSIVNTSCSWIRWSLFKNILNPQITLELNVHVCKLNQYTIYLKIVFFFDCCFTSHSRIFHPHGDATIVGERLQNIGLRSAPMVYLSREGSLSCHICCDTGPLLVHSRAKNHSYYIEVVLRTSKRHRGPTLIQSLTELHFDYGQWMIIKDSDWSEFTFFFKFNEVIMDSFQNVLFWFLSLNKRIMYVPS